MESNNDTLDPNYIAVRGDDANNKNYYRSRGAPPESSSSSPNRKYRVSSQTSSESTATTATPGESTTTTLTPGLCSSTTVTSETNASSVTGGGTTASQSATTTTVDCAFQNDELGSDLLLAIRDWNTETRIGNGASQAYCHEEDHSADGSRSRGDGYNEGKTTSLETMTPREEKEEGTGSKVTTAPSTTMTNSSTMSMPTNIDKAASSYKASNYSSKPSKITDRLLNSLSAIAPVSPPMSIIAEMTAIEDDEEDDHGDIYDGHGSNEFMHDDGNDEEEIDLCEVSGFGRRRELNRRYIKKQDWDQFDEEEEEKEEDEKGDLLLSSFSSYLEEVIHDNENDVDYDYLASPFQPQHKQIQQKYDEDRISSSTQYNDAVVKQQQQQQQSYENIIERRRVPYNERHMQQQQNLMLQQQQQQQASGSTIYMDANSSLPPPPQSLHEQPLPHPKKELTAKDLYLLREDLKKQLVDVESQLYVDHGILFQQEYGISHAKKEEENKNTAKKKENETKDAVLKDACYSLGLPRNKIEALVPTIQKMVNVVMKHVPQLEEFVEEVCNLVLVNNDDAKPTKNAKKKKKKKGKNAMKLKQQRMNDALNELRQRKLEDDKNEKEYKQDLSSPTASSVAASSIGVSHALTSVGKGDHSVSSSISAKSGGSRSTSAAAAAAISFQKAVMEQLEKRKQTEIPTKKSPKNASKEQRPLTRRSSHTSAQSSHCTKTSRLSENEEALKTIQQLIEFEYRNKKAMFSAPRELADHTKYGGLLAADASSLRRYVSYFMHLFNVRHVNGVRPKMNEVYVYSTAMTSMFRDMREALHMSPASPAQAVARRVVEISNDICSDTSLTQ